MANGHGGRRPGAGRKPGEASITVLASKMRESEIIDQAVAQEGGPVQMLRNLIRAITYEDGRPKPAHAGLYFQVVQLVLDRLFGRAIQKAQIDVDSSCPLNFIFDLNAPGPNASVIDVGRSNGEAE